MGSSIRLRYILVSHGLGQRTMCRNSWNPLGSRDHLSHFVQWNQITVSPVLSVMNSVRTDH